MSHSRDETNLQFRGDIQGLRAVGILLVVAAHAKVPWLAGGFVGVDVFFVLSGYLISGLLIREIETTRRLDFAGFYARRLRRLLPALLLMLIVTCALGRLLIAPSEQAEQARSAAYAALWLSNFFFAFSHIDYFSSGAETNLFLHTWSLGVEEQFYLIWPLLILLASVGWKLSATLPDRRRLKIASCAIFAVSLAVCIFWTAGHPNLTFYMMPMRAWQFALGMLVYMLSDERKVRASGSWLGYVGLTSIVVSAIIIDGAVPYPGAWAMLPSFGAALVLAAGGASSAGRGAGSLLSLRPMQAIGNISYAWYLWHWPVLLLGATLVSVESLTARLMLVVVSYLAALASFRLLEAPLRKNPHLVARPVIALMCFLATMIAANALAVRWHNFAQDRMLLPEQLKYVEARNDAPIIYEMGCDDWFRSAEVRICAFGPHDAAHTAVAIGDSVALQWFPAMAGIFEQLGWRLMVITKSSCPMVDESFFYPRIGREFTECSNWRREALKRIAVIKPDIVILGSSETNGFTRSQWIDGTARVLDVISPAARKLYVLRSTPQLPFDGPACLAPRSWLYAQLSSRSGCSSVVTSRHGEEVYDWLKVAASRFDNVSVIDMTDDICPGGTCRAEQQGIVVFRDSQHLSASFAKSLSGALDARLRAKADLQPSQ